MNTPPVVDDRRTASMGSLFPQTVTINGTGGGSGEFNARGAKNRQGTRPPVAGLAALPCQINALPMAREAPGAGSGESANAIFEIIFGAYYPGLSTAQEAVDDATGERYNILMVDRDPASTFSVVQAEKQGT